MGDAPLACRAKPTRIKSVPPTKLLVGSNVSQPAPGKYYNPYFATLNIGMGPPLSEGQVTFDDGSPGTVDAMAKDVAAFLTWTAEPKMMERKAVGIGTLLFLILATTLAYMSYRTIWAEKKGH